MRFCLICAVFCFLAVPAIADWDPGDGHKMHYPQLPDPDGWDVCATFPKVLADDWMCSETGWVSDIHFWGSWRHEEEGMIDKIHLSIHDNDPGPPSKPINPPLWERDFYPGEWMERWYGSGDQGWYNPNTGEFYEHDHLNYFQYNFVDIVEPFWQEEGRIYWLDISVTLADPENFAWGWKSTQDHWMDDAVYGDFPDPDWQEMYEPPYFEQSLDLAFVITPEPTMFGLLALGGLVLLRRRR